MRKKGKAKVYKVLAIDDEQEIINTLKNIARDYSIKLYEANSLEEAKAILTEDNVNFLGFILDVNCNIKKDQSSPNEAFIFKTIRYLDKHFQGYPKVILTGFSEHYNALSKYLSESNIKSFNKKSDEYKKVFEYLRNEIEDLKESKIKAKYPEVFEIFEKGYLSYQIETQLTKILINVINDEQNWDSILNNLSSIRRIQESIYIAISKKHQNIIPESFQLENSKGNLKVRPILKHLSDENFHSGIIKQFAYLIWSITSDSGAHTPYENPDYSPTDYTVQSITFALLDLLLWFKQIMENK